MFTMWVRSESQSIGFKSGVPPCETFESYELRFGNPNEIE